MATPLRKYHTTIVPLRDHPLMRRGPISNWPPVWTQWILEGTKRITGEVGF